MHCPWPAPAERNAPVPADTRTLAKCGALELQLRIQADDLARVTDDNQRLARELDIAQKEGYGRAGRQSCRA
jgi:hypothetical protein